MEMCPIERKEMYKNIVIAILRSGKLYSTDVARVATSVLRDAEREMKALTSPPEVR
jgi:hypothetical protein